MSVVINPGSGPVSGDCTFANASTNIAAFVRDLIEAGHGQVSAVPQDKGVDYDTSGVTNRTSGITRASMAELLWQRQAGHVHHFLPTIDGDQEGPSAREIVHALRDVYKPEDCGIWLYAPHKSWKGLNAVSMIEDGRLEEVRAEIERLATGAAS